MASVLRLVAVVHLLLAAVGAQPDPINVPPPGCLYQYVDQIFQGIADTCAARLLTQPCCESLQSIITNGGVYCVCKIAANEILVHANLDASIILNLMKQCNNNLDVPASAYVCEAPSPPPAPAPPPPAAEAPPPVQSPPPPSPSDDVERPPTDVVVPPIPAAGLPTPVIIAIGVIGGGLAIGGVLFVLFGTASGQGCMLWLIGILSLSASSSYSRSSSQRTLRSPEAEFSVELEEIRSG